MGYPARLSLKRRQGYLTGFQRSCVKVEVDNPKFPVSFQSVKKKSIRSIIRQFSSTENDCFLFIKVRLTAGKHICSINLNAITEFRRFAARETFYQIAATYLKVMVTDLCSEEIFFLLIGRWK